MERETRQMSELLKVLANENRLLILCRLSRGPKTVGDLGKTLPDITQSALSQHLALLKAHGILSSARAGQKMIYSISDHRVEDVVAMLKKYYCDFTEEEF